MGATWGLALQLRDDPAVVDEYKTAHRNPPECVARVLLDVGVQRMAIFLRGYQLFMFLEAESGFDPAARFAEAELDPDYRAWSEWMASLQRPGPGAADGEWWVPMETVYDLGGGVEQCPS